jgi:hypothetical protein
MPVWHQAVLRLPLSISAWKMMRAGISNGTQVLA